MSDEELDRDWQPNGRRPQSTIARSFSQELMDIFRIENSVADLDEKVDKRKQQINTQTSELEALEARIREMEERLKTQPGIGHATPNGRPSGSPRTQRPPIANAFDDPDAPPPIPEKDQQRPSSREQSYNKYNGRRPGTARESQQAVPGALPHACGKRRRRRREGCLGFRRPVVSHTVHSRLFPAEEIQRLSLFISAKPYTRGSFSIPSREMKLAETAMSILPEPDSPVPFSSGRPPDSSTTDEQSANGEDMMQRPQCYPYLMPSTRHLEFI